MNDASNRQAQRTSFVTKNEDAALHGCDAAERLRRFNFRTPEANCRTHRRKRRQQRSAPPSLASLPPVQKLSAVLAQETRDVHDPFGRLMASTGPLASANLYRFPSKQHHPFSTLYYYGYRFYDPELQRWINRDPLGEFPDGPNLYAYALNDPIILVDPDGLSVIGKSLPKVLKLIKGRRACKATSVGDAVRLYKEGEEVVMCPTKDAAKEAGKKAGKGRPPIHEIDRKTVAPHYHPNDRSGHFLYGLAGALTLSHYAEGYGGFAEGAAFVGDLVNPLSFLQDVLAIKDAIFE